MGEYYCVTCRTRRQGYFSQRCSCGNPLGYLTPLPVIDGHCHVQGGSIQKHIFTTPTPVEVAEAQKRVAETVHATGRKAEFASASGGLSFALIGSKPDFFLTEDALRSTQKAVDYLPGGLYQARTTNVATVVTGMTMDFGFVPLTGGIGGAAGGFGFTVSETITRGDPVRMTLVKTSVARKAKESKRGARTLVAGQTCYYSNPNALASEQELTWYPHSDEAYVKMLAHISHVAACFPGRSFPFVSFDPRRPGALTHATKALETQAFAGVKFYSRTGWLPSQNAALYGPELGRALDGQLEELFEYVTTKDVPVLVHTSPTGFPPDGAHVFPYRLHESGGRDQITTTEHVPPPPCTGLYKPETLHLVTETAARRATDLARWAAEEIGRYAYYVQVTTSPHSWRNVLRRHPNLRLCLAHAGSGLSLVVAMKNPFLNEPFKTKLQNNPMVVAGADFARRFRESALALAVKTSAATKLKGLAAISEDQAKLALNEVLAESGWARWLADWARRYERSWWDEIKSLIQEFPNCYTDVSYVVANSYEEFPMLMQFLVKEARAHEHVFKKVFFGTDYYMISMSKLSPRQFWLGFVEGVFGVGFVDFQGRARKTVAQIPMHEQRNVDLWLHWATYNWLRYANLGPRLNRLEALYKNVAKAQNIQVGLPDFWDHLFPFYGVRRAATAVPAPALPPRPGA